MLYYIFADILGVPGPQLHSQRHIWWNWFNHIWWTGSSRRTCSRVSCDEWICPTTGHAFCKIWKTNCFHLSWTTYHGRCRCNQRSETYSISYCGTCACCCWCSLGWTWDIGIMHRWWKFNHWNYLLWSSWVYSSFYKGFRRYCNWFQQTDSIPLWGKL